MTLGDLPPTQLYASMALVFSIATLWLSRLKEDANALGFIQGLNRFTVNAVVSTLLTWPVTHVLYVLCQSTASVGHQITHAVPLVGAMLAVIGWWMHTLAHTLAVAPTVEAEDSTSP